MNKLETVMAKAKKSALHRLKYNKEAIKDLILIYQTEIKYLQFLESHECDFYDNKCIHCNKEKI